MRLLAHILVVTLLTVLIVLAATWAALALWYRLPAPLPLRALAGGLFVLLGLATILALFTRLRLRALAVFLAAFALMLVWWGSIQPPATMDWAPDVSRQVTGTVSGNLLTLTDVRNFDWRSDSDFTPRWESRTYDLDRLQTLDLFMSYWAGPQIAHVILSFGFDDGEHIAWSVEVRRPVGGEYSPVADFFKTDALVIVAADERDVVGLRSNIRKEDVQLYRLKVSPAAARVLLREYVSDANALAATPQFYNSITTNCTTTVVKMMRAVGGAVPLDWRLVVNGYLPDYAYERGALDTSQPLAALRAGAHIDARAQAAGLTPDFSRLIRTGIPSPALPAAR